MLKNYFDIRTHIYPPVNYINSSVLAQSVFSLIITKKKKENVKKVEVSMSAVFISNGVGREEFCLAT